MKRTLIQILLVTLGILTGLYILFVLQDSDTLSETSKRDADTLEYSLEMMGHNSLQSIKADPSSHLQEFSTDGCSGGLSVGWQYLAANIKNFDTAHGSQPAWESCCVEHDRSYHSAGGKTASAQESFEARRQADLNLKACVLETGRSRRSELSSHYAISVQDLDKIYEAIANTMYAAVRVGGIPCTPLSWRWGYGWPACN